MAKPKTVPTKAGGLERAFLVGVHVKKSHPLWSLNDSLEELALLADTAGAVVVGRLTQQVEHITPYYVGKGKLGELREAVGDVEADVVIFDDELTPIQQGNLEGELNVKVLDRTALILDVFSNHARTREGRLQVELAQNQYLLPRLAGQWSHLERLGGGIGTRGPGETQLETDRRIVRRRIQKLGEELEAVRRHRGRYRSRRKKEGVPVVSLVGYTNAGKSTLLNALSQAGVLAEDRLFSTLDPVTRRIALPSGAPILLTDTVGFIQKLPTTLIAAFRATLEELQESELILHVIDVTHRNAAEQTQVVEEILGELGLSARPRVLVLNKIDLLVSDEGQSPDLSALGLSGGEHPAVLVSAARGWGLGRLLQMVEHRLSEDGKPAAALAAQSSGG